MAPSHPRPKKPTKKAGQKSSKRAAVRILTRAQVPAAVKKMAAPSGTDRFAAGKALAVTAEKDPGRVYPYFDAIAAVLESPSKVVCWNTLQILGKLVPVDVDRQADTVLDILTGFIRGNNLVSAANAIQTLSKIAQGRLDLHDRIVPAILEVEQANYATAECRNVAIGQVLGVLQELGPAVCRRHDAAAFIRKQRANPRVAVARQAERMIADLASGE